MAVSGHQETAALDAVAGALGSLRVSEEETRMALVQALEDREEQHVEVQRNLCSFPSIIASK